MVVLVAACRGVRGVSLWRLSGRRRGGRAFLGSMPRVTGSTEDTDVAPNTGDFIVCSAPIGDPRLLVRAVLGESRSIIQQELRMSVRNARGFACRRGERQRQRRDGEKREMGDIHEISFRNA